MPNASRWTETLYRSLSSDDGDRVCEAISDKACREVQGNFLRILAAQTLTGLGDRLANPKTTLAWLLQAVGAPAFFTGLIVPLRESGSLLPQLFISGFLRRLPLSKWVWVFGAVFQALAVAGYALVAWTLDGATAGTAIIGLVAVFSLARGLSSISSKDVLGKTIPKTRRGRLSGWIASLSGVMAIGAGLLLLRPGQGDDNDGSKLLYTLGLLIAASLWIGAGAIYSRIREFAGETESGGDPWRDALKRLRLLIDDRPFRNFVTVRALAIGSGLSAPFVIALAHQQLGGSAWWLGLFVIVDGLAAMVSSPLWGRWADRSSRTVLRAAMAVSATLIGGIAIASLFDLPIALAEVLFPLVFFLLGVAHSGVRLGRKTYVVDMAEGDQRTDYVAVSNSVIGVLLLVMGAVTGALSLLSVPLALGVFAALALTGVLLGGRLPDVSGRK